MIETPRTDAELHGIRGIYVEADFARELERELNHANEQRDEAIRLATLFQTLYLRLGKAEDEHYNTLMVQGAAKSLAELKGLRYFGEEA